MKRKEYWLTLRNIPQHNFLMHVTHIQRNFERRSLILSANFTFDRPFGTFWNVFTYTLKNYYYRLNKLQRHVNKPYKIWFKIPKKYGHVARIDDCFFIIGLSLALARHEDFTFDGTISDRLYKRISRFNKYFGFAAGKTSVNAVKKDRAPVLHKIGQFFTLGVDSFYTLLCHLPQKTRSLIYVEGFDVPLNKTRFLRSVENKIKIVGRKTGNKTLFAKTNLREVSDKIIGWGPFHMAALVSVGMLFGFNTIYVNGESFDAPDWGIRKGAGELFSYGKMKFLLIGHNKKREIKIQKILRSKFAPVFLKNVRVCWENITHLFTKYNCSSCQKCIKTILTLKALGVTNPPTFRPVNRRLVIQLKLAPHVIEEWQTLYLLASKSKHIDADLLNSVHELIHKPVLDFPERPHNPYARSFNKRA